MNNRIIIGLEAHDATGKSGTAIELLKIFDGEVSKVSKEMKIKRREICEPISVLKSFTEKKDYSETHFGIKDNTNKVLKIIEKKVMTLNNEYRELINEGPYKSK